jgi:phage recombination protein Bet
MSTAVATTEAPIHYSASEIALVKKTIAAGATDEELKLFLFDCKRQGVHPLDRLIHFSKRGGKYTPITSIDFMRLRADDTGVHAGTDDPVYDLPEDSDKLIRWAKVTVYKFVQSQKVAFTATARWSEYAPPGSEGFMWKKMPRLMLGKCAEALALRKAFPKQLHGIYERAEMDQAERATPEPEAPPRVEPAPQELLTLEADSNPLAEVKAGLVTRIEKFTLAKITLLMHRLDLGEGEWQNLDVAAMDLLAKSLEGSKK